MERSLKSIERQLATNLKKREDKTFKSPTEIRRIYRKKEFYRRRKIAAKPEPITIPPVGLRFSLRMDR